MIGEFSESILNSVVERDDHGWHKKVDVRGPGQEIVDPHSQSLIVGEIWNRVAESGMSPAGIRVRAIRDARTIQRDDTVVQHLSSSVFLTSGLRSKDGTFVVVRRGISHDIAPFRRSYDLDVALGKFVDDVNFVRGASTGTRSGTVLMSGAASGSLIHEAIGHLHEADNVAKFGAVSAHHLELGLRIEDIGEIPGSSHPCLDDLFQPMAPATLVGDGCTQTLLGVHDLPRASPAEVARARSIHLDSPYLARMTHIVVHPTSLPYIADAHFDVEVANVAAAFVDLPGKRLTLHLGASVVNQDGVSRRAHGGRIDLNLADLGNVLSGYTGSPVSEVSMCDKRGQRLPVATTCPSLVLSGVTIRDMAI